MNKFMLNGKGLLRFFGPLEAEIMDTIWKLEGSTIKQVQEYLNRSREQAISFNAVMTVMNRLVEKGHLYKQIRGRSFYYQAGQSKEQFLDEQTATVTESLMQDFGDFVVSHMMDSLEQVDSNVIDKLEQKLHELKNRSKYVTDHKS